MSSFHFDRVLDFLTSTELVIMLLWLGLAALSVTLLVLTRTRWGQSQPLKKCVILSLLAHFLLIGYATTVQIVTSGTLEAREPVIQISISDRDFDPVMIVEETDDVQQKPWESFAEESAVQPSPLEASRLAATDIPEPERLRQPDPDRLLADHFPDRMPLDDAVEPEPDEFPTAPDRPAPVAASPAEPIEAPKAQRRDSPDPQGPAMPVPEQRTPDATPLHEPDRKTDSGSPSSLVEQPLPLPRMSDVPTTPEPSDSLAGITASLPSPSKGAPADEAYKPESIDTAPRSPDRWRPAVELPGASTDHLNPPSLAMRDNRTNPRIDEPGLIGNPAAAVGSALLPSRRHQQPDRDVPDVYKMRVAPDRAQLSQHQGATAETEEAVRAALQWLAENQEPDGRWSAKHHGAGRESMVAGRNRSNAGIEADTGMTGLALLAFIASGNTHQDGVYSSNVRRGLEFLIHQQRRDGGMGGRAKTFAYMYCHAMATFALGEACAMTGDPSIRVPLDRAIAYTRSQQNAASGGWRYAPGDPGDTSQLGWQLMALKSAELAGIPIPNDVRHGMVGFLDSVASGAHGGLASYRPDEKVTRAMTAEAMACRQFLGFPPNSVAGREAGDYLLAELPGEGETNLYYWYYATLSMYQLQGVHWDRWNRALRSTLVASQRKGGPMAGSWDPDTVWGGYGGRVYSTALSTLCLEVYYRYLPLYGELSPNPRLPR